MSRAWWMSAARISAMDTSSLRVLSAATSALLAARGAFLSAAPVEAARAASSNRTTMARLPYVEDPTPRRGCRPAPPGWRAAPAEAEAAAAFDELRRLGRPPLNLYRILANQPAALRAFLGMSRYIRDDGA